MLALLNGEEMTRRFQVIDSYWAIISDEDMPTYRQLEALKLYQIEINSMTAFLDSESDKLRGIGM
jgi:hypothetical protein